jgi:dolichol-phosphate mannosyltransferase
MQHESPVRPLVVIPTYNECDNISRLVPAVLDADAGLHVLVVDDGSPDDTAGAVSELKDKEYAERVFLNCRPGKQGLGRAYVDGFNWGLTKGYDFLIEMDGDWSHHPRYLGRMLELATEADFVVGSRYISDGGTLNWGAGRRILSRFGSLYSRLILGVGIADFTGGFNGWSAEVLRKINLSTLRSNGYSFQIELKYRAHKLGFRHAEFPIIFDERRAGESKMSFSIALEALWRVWGLRFFSDRILRNMNLPDQSVETQPESKDIHTAG